MTAVEPGCPHCGAPGHDHHPDSLPPKAKIEKVQRAAPPPPAPPSRPDGKFAYELFVEHMGHKDVAVGWDKLTEKAQKVWTAVAAGLERRTIDALLAERARTIKNNN